MNACDHIRWGAVDPEEVEYEVENPRHTISGGEDSTTKRTNSYFRCPLCHQECDAPNQKEWTDE